MSEYEVISTMETACNKLKGYNLKEDETQADVKKWTRVAEEGKMPVSFQFGGEHPDLGALNFEKSIGEQRSVREYDDKIITAYCHTVLEEREDLITAAIADAQVTESNAKSVFENILCVWDSKKSPCTASEVEESKDEL